MVSRLELTYTEILDIFEVKNIAGPTTGYTKPQEICEVIDNNLMLRLYFSKS